MYAITEIAIKPEKTNKQTNKFRGFRQDLNSWPSRCYCDALTNWATKASYVGSGQLWIQILRKVKEMTMNIW